MHQLDGAGKIEQRGRIMAKFTHDRYQQQRANPLSGAQYGNVHRFREPVALIAVLR